MRPGAKLTLCLCHFSESKRITAGDQFEPGLALLALSNSVGASLADGSIARRTVESDCGVKLVGRPRALMATSYSLRLAADSEE